MLTFLVTCVTIILVGCENGNNKINEFESGEKDFLYTSGEKEVEKSRRDKNPRR